MIYKKYFTSREAARLSGLTYSMVDYLVREKIVLPSNPRMGGRGKRRRYLFGEVVLLKTVKKLLSKGISVKRLKNALVSKNTVFRNMTPEQNPIQFFVTDGNHVFLRENLEHGGSLLVDLTNSGQMAFNFILDLQVMHEEVKAALQAA